MRFIHRVINVELFLLRSIPSQVMHPEMRPVNQIAQHKQCHIEINRHLHSEHPQKRIHVLPSEVPEGALHANVTHDHHYIENQFPHSTFVMSLWQDQTL